MFEHFLSEYRAGRTPNPDVVCNKEIKFKEFLRRALVLGADCIATGHYARLGRDNRHCLLRKGLDDNKDQSYFLHTLDQEALRHARFPIGEMQKEQVRAMAKELGLPVHDKKDSTGICFIGERRFHDFLSRYLPAQEGEIKSLDGEVLGEHRGCYFYTIGQRQGLGIGGEGRSLGTWRGRMSSGTSCTSFRDTIMRRCITGWYWRKTCTGSPAFRRLLPGILNAKVRYRQADQPCEINMIGPNYSRIVFDEPQWAVTPGQSIVFYDEDTCIGGGIIRDARD